MKRAAIIGYGGMGSWHANKIMEGGVLELAGIYDLRQERLDLAESRGIHAYPSCEALLADDTVETVTVATPNDVHKELVIKALRAGKNVICEKPVTMTSADLQDMFEESYKAKKLFTVHQNRRLDNDYLTVKKIIASDAIGDVLNIESRVQGSRGVPGDWRKKKEHGGGMVLDWGVHLLDQALMTFDCSLKSVYANLDYITTKEVDDGIKVTLLFENGVRYYVEVGTSNFITLPRWYVSGTNGTAVIQDWHSDARVVSCIEWGEECVIPVQASTGITKTMAPRSENTIREHTVCQVVRDVHDFYRNFIAAIDGREEQMVTHSQMMRTVRLMEAVFESARDNKTVAFE